MFRRSAMVLAGVLGLGFPANAQEEILRSPREIWKGDPSIVAVASAPGDGPLAISAAGGRPAVVLLGPEGRERCRMRGHFQAASKLAWSPDGSLLVAVGRGRVSLFEAATGRLLDSYDGATVERTRMFFAAAFSPDSRVLVVAATLFRGAEIHRCDLAQGTWRRIELQDRDEEPRGNGIGLAFTATGEIFVLFRNEGLLVEQDSGEERRRIRAEDTYLEAMSSWPGQDRIVVLATQKVGSTESRVAPEGGGPGEVREIPLFEDRIWILKPSSWETRVVECEPGTARRIALSPGGRWCAVAAANGTIVVRELDDGRVAQSLPTGLHVDDLAFAGSGSWLALGTADGRVMRSNLATPDPAPAGPPPAAPPRIEPSPAARAVFDVAGPDGNFVRVESGWVQACHGLMAYTGAPTSTVAEATVEPEAEGRAAIVLSFLRASGEVGPPVRVSGLPAGEARDLATHLRTASAVAAEPELVGLGNLAADPLRWSGRKIRLEGVPVVVGPQSAQNVLHLSGRSEPAWHSLPLPAGEFEVTAEGLFLYRAGQYDGVPMDRGVWIVTRVVDRKPAEE